MSILGLFKDLYNVHTNSEENKSVCMCVHACLWVYMCARVCVHVACHSAQQNEVKSHSASALMAVPKRICSRPGYRKRIKLTQ